MSQPSLLARLQQQDSNTLSDALDFLNLPGATYGLRPLWDCPKLVGRASTVQLGRKSDAAPTVHLISPVIAAIDCTERVLVIVVLHDLALAHSFADRTLRWSTSACSDWPSDCAQSGRILV